MTAALEIRTLDYHAAGEPLRIVTVGLPSVLGDSMAEKRRYMAEHFDHIRKLLIHEPRGHADMYGAIITLAVTPGSDCGVLFMHNEGYSTMCGHGIIALTTAVMDHGLLQIANPDVFRIDTPAGLVVAHPERDDGGVRSVTFENVPAFVQGSGKVTVGGLDVPFTIAFGGAYYAYVDAGALGLQLETDHARQLVSLGRAIKQAVVAETAIAHPAGEDDLGFLYGVIFMDGKPGSGRLRNVCVFADGELDRSPTGTGVSGRVAIHLARGEIGPGDTLDVESIIGTQFSVRCGSESQVGDMPAVVTEVTGSAHQTGSHSFILEDNDPLTEGFFIR